MGAADQQRSLSRGDFDLQKVSITDFVKKAIPPSFARKYNVIPVARTEQDDGIDELVAAFRNFEGDTEEERIASIVDILEATEDTTGMRVTPVFPKSSSDFDVLLARLYPMGTQIGGVLVGSEILFRDLLNAALIQRASDIHIDARENGGNVRFRIDGKMREIRSLNLQEYTEMVAVIKLKADLDMAERRIPLDGAISLDTGAEQIDLRVATIPTLNGEHVTLRILASSMGSDLKEIDKLCFSGTHLDQLKSVLELPSGIVVVSGPTGSGKTTTLYAALRYLRDMGGRHIVSLEDPVEMPLPGVTQVKIDSGNERVTFNKALRSVLRHDPDVVLVGEIRDEETADIAVRAALTGHLVLSTLHTNDAIGVVTRLLDLGVPDYLLASTLKLAMAQRLVRRPSAHSLKHRQATPEECVYMECDEANPPQVPVPVGSDFDGGTGYAGRVAIYELIPIDATLRRMISKRADEREMAEYAFGQLGMATLRRDGVRKALEDVTTLEEVKAVAGF